MESREKISVAMAAYNGEKYIREQIDSILMQLGPMDELVISDDGSTDGTKAIVAQMAQMDGRIRLLKGPGRGVKQNFANAIAASDGDYIFLCDQDDIWLPGKVARVMEVFAGNPDCSCVLHDCRVTDAGCENTLQESYFAFRGSGLGVLQNIWKNSYVGCCMAFRASLKAAVLPIPDDIVMHDQWIGIIGELLGENYLLKEPLLLYRRHDDNVTGLKHHGFGEMLRGRIHFISAICKWKRLYAAKGGKIG